MKNDSDRETRDPQQEKPDAGNDMPPRSGKAAEDPGASAPASWQSALPTWLVGGVVVAAVFAWAYWPTLVELVRTWDREPDYSHGYFVAPLALFFLWARREWFPGMPGKIEWLGGFLLIGMSIGLRAFAASWFLGAVEGWSILFWVAGVVCLFGGWRVLWWALPSVAFLFFMIPLPYRVERWASLPLQRVAATISCWVLQCFGQPALAEGNTILLGEHHLEVEQACSGLRIFMGIVALAFAYVIITRRSWWVKGLLLAAVLPIALIANSTRIIITGFFYQLVSGEAAQKFSHDAAGWVMILFAAALFALVLWYLGKLIREVEMVDVSAVMRREQRA